MTRTSISEFNRLRSLLLNRPTIPGCQIALRLSEAFEENSKEDEVNNPLVKARLQKQPKFDANLIIHYTYERRLQNNKRDLHKSWNQAFEETPVKNTRLITENRNSRNLTRELVHHRPSSTDYKDNTELT